MQHGPFKYTKIQSLMSNQRRQFPFRRTRCLVQVPNQHLVLHSTRQSLCLLASYWHGRTPSSQVFRFWDCSVGHSAWNQTSSSFFLLHSSSRACWLTENSHSKLLKLRHTCSKIQPPLIGWHFHSFPRSRGIFTLFSSNWNTASDSDTYYIQ